MMITKVTYNEETKETTTESILTAEDEPCGTETNYKYEYDLKGIMSKKDHAK